MARSVKKGPFIDKGIVKAVENGFGHREWIEQDGDLDALRGLPRFQQLLKRL